MPCSTAHVCFTPLCYATPGIDLAHGAVLPRACSATSASCAASAPVIPLDLGARPATSSRLGREVPISHQAREIKYKQPLSWGPT
eukprot:2577715-Rhodomonas_salina.1